MVLGFKEYFDNEKKKPTNFRAKILAGVGMAVVDYSIEGSPIIQARENTERLTGFSFHSTGVDIYDKKTIPALVPKIHTIREGNRWKKSDLIHMATGVRTKKYHQFNKDIPELQTVKDVQSIIIYNDQYNGLCRLIVEIDNKPYGEIFEGSNYETDHKKINTLAINDGFDPVLGPGTEYLSFWKWFNGKTVGQIIHWTDRIRY